jgi:hypothetical protein
MASASAATAAKNASLFPAGAMMEGRGDVFASICIKWNLKDFKI